MTDDDNNGTDDELLRNDLPEDDAQALRELDIHARLVTEGLHLSNDITEGVMDVLIPLFRLKIDSPI